MIHKLAALIGMHDCRHAEAIDNQLEKCVSDSHCRFIWQGTGFSPSREAVHNDENMPVTLLRGNRHVQNIYSHPVPPVTNENMAHWRTARTQRLPRQAY